MQHNYKRKVNVKVTLGQATKAQRRRRSRGKYVLRPAVKSLHQLSPIVTASSVSVESRVFKPKHTSCVPRLVRNCIICIKRYGCTKVQQLEGSYTVLLYITLYTIICIHTELLNDIDDTVVISCYGPDTLCS